MKLLSVGHLLEMPQLQMTKLEISQWTARFEKQPVEVFKAPTKGGMMRAYQVQGQWVIVYEVEEKQDG